jgi:hypothetical protein
MSDRPAKRRKRERKGTIEIDGSPAQAARINELAASSHILTIISSLVQVAARMTLVRALPEQDTETDLAAFAANVTPAEQILMDTVGHPFLLDVIREVVLWGCVAYRVAEQEIGDTKLRYPVLLRQGIDRDGHVTVLQHTDHSHTVRFRFRESNYDSRIPVGVVSLRPYGLDFNGVYDSPCAHLIQAWIQFVQRTSIMNEREHIASRPVLVLRQAGIHTSSNRRGTASLDADIVAEGEDGVAGVLAANAELYLAGEQLMRRMTDAIDDYGDNPMTRAKNYIPLPPGFDVATTLSTTGTLSHKQVLDDFLAVAERLLLGAHNQNRTRPGETTAVIDEATRRQGMVAIINHALRIMDTIAAAIAALNGKTEPPDPSPRLHYRLIYPGTDIVPMDDLFALHGRVDGDIGRGPPATK